MKFDDEMLMAYADGELAPADAARVEAAMAHDPSLADVVASHRALRRTLGAGFAPALDEPVPEHLLAMLRQPQAPAGNVVALAPRRERAPARRWALPEWGAIAAACVLGIAVSQWGIPRDEPMLQRGVDGELVAGRGLAAPLERQLAGDAREGSVAIAISFRNADGRYCRSFVTEAAQPLSGLACRRPDGRWQVAAVMEAALSPGGELEQASSALPPALLAEIDARIAGEPLDAAQEMAARDAGWR